MLLAPKAQFPTKVSAQQMVFHHLVVMEDVFFSGGSSLSTSTGYKTLYIFSERPENDAIYSRLLKRSFSMNWLHSRYHGEATFKHKLTYIALENSSFQLILFSFT